DGQAGTGLVERGSETDDSGIELANAVGTLLDEFASDLSRSQNLSSPLFIVRVARQNLGDIFPLVRDPSVEGHIGEKPLAGHRVGPERVDYVLVKVVTNQLRQR